jgi:hypothetical protein
MEHDASIGLIAHVLRELVSDVGLIASHVAPDETELMESLEELHATTTRLSNAFPPPPQNGGPR